MGPRSLNLRTNMLAMMALSIGSFPSAGPEQEPERPREPALIPPTPTGQTYAPQVRGYPGLVTGHVQPPTQEEGRPMNNRAKRWPVVFPVSSPTQTHLHQITGSGKECPCGHHLSGQELREARERRAKAEGRSKNPPPSPWDTSAAPPVIWPSNR